MGIASLEYTVGRQNKAGERIKTNNWVYRLRVERNDDQEETVRRIFKVCKALKARRNFSEGTRLLIPTPKGISEKMFRKLLECVFQDSGATVVVFGPKRQDGLSRQQSAISDTERRKPRNKKQGLESITVEAPHNMDYADMLKRVKTGVDLRDTGQCIVGIRKTERGNLMVTTKGNREEVERLKKKIEGTMEGAKARHRPRQEGKILHVRDIEALTQLEEVEEALRGCTQGAEGIDVKSMRPSFGDTQTATVVMPEEAARKIAEEGSIRIGLVRCRVRMRMEILTCHRCWEAGHLARNCKGIDRKGSAASDPFCLLCVEKGHSAGNTGCPKFREAISKARGKEAPGRRGNTAFQ